MHRSRSISRRRVVTPGGRNVWHYRRKRGAIPHCAICGKELNGISIRGGRTRRTNSRAFGGVLCANCNASIIKMRSRVEGGEMRLDEIGMRERAYVLQLFAH